MLICRSQVPHGKVPGASPQVPQHVFVGNMVAPPYAVMPLQMPLMGGPQGQPPPLTVYPTRKLAETTVCMCREQGAM